MFQRWKRDNCVMDVVTFFSQGHKIIANSSIPFNGAPGVIMSHGMEGSKDGAKWQLLAVKLYEAGIASLRFNYRGCGEGKDQSEGKFEDTTLGSRIQDFKAALDYFHGTPINNSRLGVIGSSLGGVIAIAAWDKRIKAMVTLATPYRLLMPTDSQLGNIQENDYINLPTGRKIKTKFFEEMRHYDGGHDIGQVKCPILVIHGTADEVVPVDQSRQYYDKANEPKKLERIQGGKHSLDEPTVLQHVVDLAIDWFKRYL